MNCIQGEGKKIDLFLKIFLSLLFKNRLLVFSQKWVLFTWN